MAEEKPRIEEIEAEYVFDIHKACELLSKPHKKITPETHWIRVTHEVTRDAAPWALLRFQAIKRG